MLPLSPGRLSAFEGVCRQSGVGSHDQEHPRVGCYDTPDEDVLVEVQGLVPVARRQLETATKGVRGQTSNCIKRELRLLVSIGWYGVCNLDLG